MTRHVTLFTPSQNIEVGDVIFYKDDFAFVQNVANSEDDNSFWFTLEFGDGTVIEEEYRYGAKVKKPGVS